MTVSVNSPLTSQSNSAALIWLGYVDNNGDIICNTHQSGAWLPLNISKFYKYKKISQNSKLSSYILPGNYISIFYQGEDECIYQYVNTGNSPSTFGWYYYNLSTTSNSISILSGTSISPCSSGVFTSLFHQDKSNNIIQIYYIPDKNQWEKANLTEKSTAQLALQGTSISSYSEKIGLWSVVYQGQDGKIYLLEYNNSWSKVKLPENTTTAGAVKGTSIVTNASVNGKTYIIYVDTDGYIQSLQKYNDQWTYTVPNKIAQSAKAATTTPLEIVQVGGICSIQYIDTTGDIWLLADFSTGWASFNLSQIAGIKNAALPSGALTGFTSGNQEVSIVYEDKNNDLRQIVAPLSGWIVNKVTPI